ncbi:MAG: hypothetical protein KTM48_01355 [Wolbachia endosymbiont of Pissodes strobi]|nr:hypothetical protein [Wolbachia endosymbiont of Pissodes strobi]
MKEEISCSDLQITNLQVIVVTVVLFNLVKDMNAVEIPLPKVINERKLKYLIVFGKVDDLLNPSKKY